MKVRIERFEDLRNNEKFSFIHKGNGHRYIGYQLKERKDNSIIIYYNTDMHKPPYSITDVTPDIFDTYYIEVERNDKIKYRNS